ncbi:PhzF family phenazine biosynthesis protein [Phaeobacter sp. PT47_59]|uniref:PhzF family phenazine biosynthesis protein n=1 Tax=Phaeobacter sp. PT47_59 TaxID=3029979 RepID=UPI0023802DA1|nr:PhzF family phenazine biosynthesis protein [Phaeobacter sp. PT47_59]MDE4173451.1 PhzF family phenazine biosynthesis protein [Phaeobacter sp. PT47_59]
MPQLPPLYNFIHCDVFAARPYAGNSLSVFPDSKGLRPAQMLTMTQELRHFESIFLDEHEGHIKARVFDLVEELPFAGHPIIGAACSLHRASGAQGTKEWRFTLRGDRRVRITTTARAGRYFGTLDQGRPCFLATVPDSRRAEFARAFNLAPSDLADLPLEVISTGLKYLVIPVKGGLEQARITIPDLETRLHILGAEFAYLFDVTRLEGRHWNNDGVMEDVATGSAAGVIGAYALKHGLVPAGRSFSLQQGHFMDRPSELRVTPYGSAAEITRVTVTGEVSFVGSGALVAPRPVSS